MSEHATILPTIKTIPASLKADAVPVSQQSRNLYSDSLQYFPVQRKLSIGAVDDPLEDEADDMADKVMRMPEQNFIQRKCTHCEEEKAQRKPLTSFIQKKETAGNSIASDTISSQIQFTKGSGTSMHETTKSFMESRFGTDFSNVKVHTGNYASQLSKDLNAQAFTVGNDIYFNEGKYQPENNEGKHLLAHELTHTIQQKDSKHIQRQVERKIDGEITIKWVDSSDEIFRRIRGAVSKKFHVPEGSLFQPADTPSRRIYAQLARGEGPKKGTPIRIHVSFYYTKGEFITSVNLSLPQDSLAKTEKISNEPACPMLPAPTSAESRVDRRKEALFYARWFGILLEKADRYGDESAVFGIYYNGTEMIPYYHSTGTGLRPSSSRIPFLCTQVEKEHLIPFVDMMMISLGSYKPGFTEHWEIVFMRDGRGVMQFVRSTSNREEKAKIPKLMPMNRARTEAEELEALGIPDRKKIYAGIFREAEHQLKEAGVMIVSFGLEQLILWYLGGIILKGLGMLVGAAGRAAFPRLVALLKLGNEAAGAALSRGVAALSEAEQAEFAILMGKVESGVALESTELANLERLMGRIEASLPVASKAAAGGRLLHMANQAGVRAEIAEGKIAVYLHGTTEEAAASMIKNPGSFLTTTGGRQGGRFFAATDIVTAEHFAGRAVAGTTSAPSVVGVALEQETIDALVAEGLVTTKKISDRGMLEVIFEPGAIEKLNEQGFFFLVIP